jgi:hypothetical protein
MSNALTEIINAYGGKAYWNTLESLPKYPSPRDVFQQLILLPTNRQSD